MLTESTTPFVFVEKLDCLLHQFVRLFYYRLELLNSRELFDVNNIIDNVGHADNKLDYFFVTRVFNIQDLVVHQYMLAY